jgi:death-on-curing protein
MKFRWITRDIAMAAHTQSLSDHGGSPGVRDESLLESALARPQNLSACGEPTVYSLAAALAYGLPKNHPFIDGNKRTAFLCGYTFLGLNGAELDADEAEAAAIMVDLAAGEVTEEEFAHWLRVLSVPI